MKISDLLIKDRISLDVKSTTKVDIIKELARLHEKTGVLNDYDGYVEALMAREAQSSTGIGEGIAIPHAKTKYVKKPALAWVENQKELITIHWMENLQHCSL